MQFTLDSKLENDSHRLGMLGDAYLLLMKNAHYPWFVLVPRTQETEFHRLNRTEQQTLLAQINSLCAFIEQRFEVDKLNIATIGNVVSQLHIHVIGRYHSDPTWPNVVWGRQEFKPYIDTAVDKIREDLRSTLEWEFNPA